MDLFKNLNKTLAKSDDNKTLTENGAVTYKSIGNKLIDLDSSVTSLRNLSAEEVMKKFEEVYLENPENAITWLFMVGDIRQGKGERDTFNRCMDFLVKQNPAVVGAVMPLIPEYTRWDYATRLMLSNDFSIRQKATSFVVNQLKKDIKDAKEGKQISLLAKWLPSINTKKEGQRKIVFKIEKELEMDHKTYRKTIAGLRDKLNIIEKSLSAKDISNIDMSSLTSHQNLKYGPVLQRIDPEARQAFLDRVVAGEAKMNADVVYPYEICHRYTEARYWDMEVKSQDMNLEAMWKMLPREVGDDTLVIRDGSASMTSAISNKTSTTCLDVATALSIYCAEQLQGPMKDKFITFSSHPEIVDMSHLNSLHDKLQLCYEHDDCSNTNIKKTFDMLLKTYVDAKAPQEEMPKNILIVSDMEFDSCMEWDKTVFEVIQNDFKEQGYELPRLIFWHVNPYRTIQPLIDNERGLVTISGFSTDVYNMVMRGEFDKIVIDKDTGEKKVVTMTPEEQMEKRLSAERYAPVRKAIFPVLYPEKNRENIIQDISIETAKAEEKKQSRINR